MAENSKIEWTDHTFNPWIGCTRVSPACDNCYAAAWAHRLGQDELWEGSRRRTTEANWRKPVIWNSRHEAFYAEHGRRQRVFCASLADVFDYDIDFRWRIDLFDLIRQTPDLDWLLLTKRVGNFGGAFDEMLCDVNADHRSDNFYEWAVDWECGYPPKNVWLGATVVNQQEADRDIPKLLQTPAAVRFLSMEPLLGPVQMRRFLDTAGWRLDWVIVGGESGPKARPMDPAWCHQIAVQCSEVGVPFFMKQGSQANWPHWKDRSKWPDRLQQARHPDGER